MVEKMELKTLKEINSAQKMELMTQELFIFTNKGLGEYSVSDAGLFMQNLMLGAHARGLGTCAQGAVALWSDPIRKQFEIPKGYKLLCGIAIGYPSDHKVNSFEAERLPIQDIKLKDV